MKILMANLVELCSTKCKMIIMKKILNTEIIKVSFIT